MRKIMEQGNPLSNTIKDTSYSTFPATEICRDRTLHGTVHFPAGTQFRSPRAPQLCILHGPREIHHGNDLHMRAPRTRARRRSQSCGGKSREMVSLPVGLTFVPTY